MSGGPLLAPAVHRDRRATWLRAAALVALWSIPGLISASQLSFVWSPDLPFGVALLWQMPPWWFWALATPVIVGLGRRFRLERATLWKSLAVHVLANIVAAAAHLSVSITFARLAEQSFFMNEFSGVLGKMALKNIHTEILLYWGILAAGHAAEYQRRFRERAVAAAQLEGKLAQAQLEALRMQLHPHFLFNTLHAISVLVRKQDTQGSIRMIAGLSELLRLALDNVGQQVVPLKQELDFVDRYLAIEQTRFQDRLTVSREIASDVLDAEIPNLILQPLVENTIRHGLASRAAPGEIALTARRDADTLVVTISDDGAGLREGWREGVGLGNVRARLAQLYGPRGRVTLAARPGGGTVATVEVPFRHA